MIPLSVHSPEGSQTAHADLISRAIPDWLGKASIAGIRAYQAALQASRTSAVQVDTLNQAFYAPTAFAKPRLNQAFKQRFNRDVEVERAEWVQFNRGSALLGLPLTVSRRPLLEAAMSNFTSRESEAGHFTADTLLLQPDALRLQVAEQGRRWRYSWHYHARDVVPVAPDAFAALCRELDLGAAYQTHFEAVYRPVGEQGTQVSDTLRNHIRRELTVCAWEASLKGHVDAEAFAMLQALCSGGTETVQWSGAPVQLGTLKALVTWTHAGTPLYGPLVIQAQGSSNASCVVYIPGEPDTPVKQYASFQAFSQALRKKLRAGAYQAWFARFVAQAEHQAFFARLIDTLSPRPFSLGLEKPRLEDPKADIGLRFTPLEDDWLPALQGGLLDKLGADARFFVAPTASIDEAQRDARRQHYLQEGLSLLNVASLFVPGLGPLMAVVGAAQLLGELFVGIDDWTHGQTDEALKHFFDVAANLALVGATVAAGVALQRSPFVAGMLPIVDTAGQTRLWHAQLEDFAVSPVPAEALQADPVGQYLHEGQSHVKLGERFYRARLDAKEQQWHVHHPDPTIPWRVPLQHNGEGAWRAAHENPSSWTANQALRRFGPLLDGFDELTLQRIRHASGISAAELRRLHGSNRPLPATLKACIAEFRTGQPFGKLMLEEGTAALGVPASHPGAALHRDFPRLPFASIEEILAGANSREQVQLTEHKRVPLRLALQARQQVWDIQLDSAIIGLLDTRSINPQTTLLRERLLDGVAEADRAALNDQGLFRLAVRDRATAARLIGQRRPAVHGPQRLADGRAGYLLSGRRPPAERSETSSPQAYAVRQALRDAEYARLDSVLSAWAEQSATVADAEGEHIAVQPHARETARQRILAAWRGEAPRVGVLPGRASRLFLDLSELRVGTLPVFTGDFSQVGYLTLEDSDVRQLAPGFLLNFPRLEQLDLQNNFLGELPSDIASLRYLQSLSLDNNRLLPSDDMFDALADLPDLQALILRGNPMRLPAAAVERLGSLSALRYLALSNTDAVGMAGHLPALARLPNLESLWLRGNELVLTPTAMQALGSMSSLDYLDLSDNPLGPHLDLTLLGTVGSLRLRGCQLAEWPESLTQVMRREPPTLRWVELDDNPITQVPELQDLAFFRAQPQVSRPLSMSFAGLSPVSVLRLQAVGITFDYLQILAQSAEPGAALRLAALQANPDARRMLQILGRLSETADYRVAPAALASRAWALIDAAQASSALRSELFAVADRPETCADQVIVLFGDLEQRLMYAQAEDPSLDSAQRDIELLNISRSLFRLDRLTRIAREEVHARAVRLDISDDEIDELEVVLAYRIGLARRLGLLGQPQGMLFGTLEPVTAAQLDTAATQVLAAETHAVLLEWHMSQTYWLSYLRRRYATRLETLAATFASRRQALDASEYDADYDERLVALQVEEQAAQMTLLRTLTQQAMPTDTEVGPSSASNM